jgi:hypothetical protein
MEDISDAKNMVARSLIGSPCTLEDLHKRDFCKNISIGNLDRIIFWLEQDHVLFQKNNKYHVYKRFHERFEGE